MSQAELDGRTEQNAKGMAKAIALLPSDAQKEGSGLQRGDAGKFCMQEPIGLATLGRIIDDLPGKINHRASIPDVFAQEICFDIMLTSLTEANREENSWLLGQWRGALCVALLYPILFATEQEAKWIEIRIGAEETNVFLEALYDTLPRDHPYHWSTFCILNSGKEVLPLLQFSSKTLVVPSASSKALECCGIPWVKKTGKQVFFTDPLTILSLEQLQFLKDGLQYVRQRLPDAARIATAMFLQDTQVQIEKRQGNVEHAEQMDVLLKALFLRDVQENDIWVQAVPWRNAEDLSDRDRDFLSPKMKERGKFAIRVGQKTVAFLDRDKLLWLLNPEDWKEDNAYINLRKNVKKSIDSNEGLRSLVRSKCNMLLRYFPENGPLLEVARTCPNDSIDPEPIHIPLRPRSKRLEETCQLPEQFKGLEPLFCASAEPDQFFSAKIAVCPAKGYDAIFANQWQSNFCRLYREEEQRQSDDWAIRAGTEQSRLKSVRQWEEKFCFLPFGEFGGQALQDALRRRYEVQISLIQKEDIIQAEFSILLDHIRLFYATTFQKHQILEIKQEELPAIGFWPDSTNLRGAREWSQYYTYIHWGISESARQFRATTYDLNGQRIPMKDSVEYLPDQTQNPAIAWLHWHIYRSSVPPGFCLLEQKGIPIGIVKCESPQNLPRAEAHARLAIDFGTTSTVGAMVLAQNSDTRVFLQDVNWPVHLESPIAWQLNKRNGLDYSVDSFIADKLNVHDASRNGIPVLFSIVKQFNHILQGTVDGDEVHQDGHIHFLKEGPVTFSTNGDDLDFEMKLRDINSSENARSIRLFLRQILEMYLLACRQRGIGYVDIRFAVPLALTNDQREGLRLMFARVAREVGKKAGVEIKSVNITSESNAVGTYFANLPRATHVVEAVGVLALDIGGGTSDYSFWQKTKIDSNTKPVTKLNHSTKLAGHEMVANVLYTWVREQGAMSWIADGLVEAAGSDRVLKSRLERYIESLENASKMGSSHFAVAFDQFIVREGEVLKKALATQKWMPLLQILIFELAELFWLARIIVEPEIPALRIAQNLSDANEPLAISLCLAGNGARYYAMLPKPAQELIVAVMGADLAGVEFSIVMSDDDKMKGEVVQGLLLCDSFEEGNAEASQSSLSPSELQERFVNFLKAYKDNASTNNSEWLLSSVETRMAAYQSGKNLKFLQKVQDIQSLSEYLQSFRDIILTDKEEDL